MAHLSVCRRTLLPSCDAAPALDAITANCMDTFIPANAKNLSPTAADEDTLARNVRRMFAAYEEVTKAHESVKVLQGTLQGHSTSFAVPELLSARVMCPRYTTAVASVFYLKTLGQPGGSSKPNGTVEAAGRKVMFGTWAIAQECTPCAFFARSPNAPVDASHSYEDAKVHHYVYIATTD